MIIIIRALPREERMMETMIPPQVGMRLRTNKKRERPNKKREAPPQKKKGQCYYPFSTLVLQSSTMIFMIESLLFCHFHIQIGRAHV